MAMMTLLYCVLAFILGLGLGWAIFKPSENDDEDEDDEMMDWHPRYAPTMEEDLMKDAEEDDKDEEPISQKDMCNGCIHLICTSNQDSEYGYDWECRKRNAYICSTLGLLDAVRRPSECEEKED